MIVKLGFNPADLKPEDEAYIAFKAGGMTLKFWALYKKHFITNQYFRESLKKLAKHMEKMLDKDNNKVAPYQDIEQFIELLRACGFFGHSYYLTPEHRSWVIKYWDYFNLNVQRSIQIEHKAIKEVTETLKV